MTIQVEEGDTVVCRVPKGHPPNALDQPVMGVMVRADDGRPLSRWVFVIADPGLWEVTFKRVE